MNKHEFKTSRPNGMRCTVMIDGVICDGLSSDDVHDVGSSVPPYLPMIPPLTATLFHGETRHEIKAADGRIILIADILPGHAQQIVRAVNSHSQLVAAAKIALNSLEVLAKIDADNTGVDVSTCEYKGTKELRAVLKPAGETK